LIGDLFSNDAFTALRTGISASSLRQQVIAGNIANINTPGYKKQAVSFEDEFKLAVRNKMTPTLTTTDPEHMPGGRDVSSVQAKVTTINSSSMREDGNNVDIDEEMSNLAENGLRYNAMAQLMGSHFSTLRTVINGGR
jgi:flagellar basal-body rod protein FlgB